MRATRALIPLVSGMLFAGCIAAGDGDPYSQVVGVCNYPVPELGAGYTQPNPKIYETYLTPECKAALEAVIPYDNESFKSAAVGFKDKVTEALHALIAYPLVIPRDNLLLGVANPRAGAIPLDVVEIFSEGSNPNQAIFNYVVNRLDRVKYDGKGTPGTHAYYGVDLAIDLRLLRVYDTFWRADEAVHTRDPFFRASTLIHEARHGDGFQHLACTQARAGTSESLCDSELQGGWGMEVAYLHYLVQGNEGCQSDECGPGLAASNLSTIAWAMCGALKNRVNNGFAVFEPILAEVECHDWVGARFWLMKHEHLTRAPFDWRNP